MPEQEIHRRKLSRTVFDKKWKSIIRKELNEWSRGGVPLRASAKEDIWMAFYAFGEHCVENYLDGPNETLDRYKLAACYLCAILAARPMVVEKLQLDDVRYNANEYAAIHVACSILAGYTIEAIEASALNERDKAVANVHVLDGLLFDNAFPTAGETYLLSALKALQFTAVERRYNLLLTALLMYHWEMALVGDGELFDALVTGRPLVSRSDEVHAEAAVAQAQPTEMYAAQESMARAPQGEVRATETADTTPQAHEASSVGAQATETSDATAPHAEALDAEAAAAELEADAVDAHSNEKSAALAGVQAEDGQRTAVTVGGDTGEKSIDALSRAKVTPPVSARELIASGRMSQRERQRERKA